MPPKGGSSIPFMAALNNVIFLPVTLVKTILFYPMNMCMWLLVDIIGDGKYKFLGTDWLRSFPFVKASAGYVKEFRAVLIDYFSWPKTKKSGGSKSCKNCKKDATWWCVDCAAKFCNQCGFLVHAPGTNSAGHSLERILNEKDQACRFITPILPAILATIIGLYTVFYCTLVTENYLTSQITCPMVSTVRTTMATVDANLYARYKAQIFGWCDSEDSFFRFILDFWVRGVVTDTDNTVLVFQTLPQAVLFDIVLMIVAVPVVAVFYAILASACTELENYVGRSPETEELERQALTVAKWWGYFFSEVSSVPPQTAERLRDATDPIEGIMYSYKRQVRHVKFYFYETHSSLQNAVQQLLVGTTVVRLACIWLRLGPVLRVLSSSVFYNTVAQQRAWFVGAHDDFLSERVLWKFGKSVYTVGTQFTRHLPVIVKVCASIWFVLSAIALVAFAYFCDWVLKKRREQSKAQSADMKTAASEWNAYIAKYTPQTDCPINHVFAQES